MQREILPLVAASPGLRHSLQVLRFGVPGAGPKAMIQAALHADEVPALLVAQQLRQQLALLEARGELRGEVVLVPYANPVGLSQQLLGRHQGRFHLGDGINFNRQVPDLGQAAAQWLKSLPAQDGLCEDPQANARLVREALRQAAAALTAHHPVEDLKNRLLQLAIDSDIVLDLHCDGEAVLHLYALTPQADQARMLGQALGAQAILLATESGDSPFDEACSRPWLLLQQELAPRPLALGCFSVTVELRGEADTSHALAQQDAQAILGFLHHSGVLAGPLPALPPPRCEPTPLAASEPIVAPHAGVVVFHQAPGDRVPAGALIADLVDVDSGQRTPLHCRSAGLLYARCASRWALPGARLAKIAGTELARTGKLLSP